LIPWFRVNTPPMSQVNPRWAQESEEVILGLESRESGTAVWGRIVLCTRFSGWCLYNPKVIACFYLTGAARARRVPVFKGGTPQSMPNLWSGVRKWHFSCFCRPSAALLLTVTPKWSSNKGGYISSRWRWWMQAFCYRHGKRNRQHHVEMRGCRRRRRWKNLSVDELCQRRLSRGICAHCFWSLCR